MSETRESNEIIQNTDTASNDNSTRTKRKYTKRKGTDILTPKEEEKQKKLLDYILGLSQASYIRIKSVAECRALLSLILPFLKIVLAENMFSFLLGILSVFTSLTIKQIAGCAHVTAKTVSRQRRLVMAGTTPDVRRQRKKGGGRKRFSATSPEIAKEILRYVELRAYGPCTQSTDWYTAATLESIGCFVERKFGVHVSETAIRNLLIENGYKPRTNKKYLYGNQATETDKQRIIRHEQFDYIDTILSLKDDPKYILLSTDTKRKEDLGNYKRTGKSWSKDGIPVDDHDFKKTLNIKSLKDLKDLLTRQEGKAIPYGIYDIGKNKAYFNVGISHDTAEFAAESIYRYWPQIKLNHPWATTLCILCDGGGSNSAKHNDFKYQMARLSKRIGMKIMVVHYPPYRSKFNKIERMVFAPVSKLFERQPLLHLAMVLELLRNTTTKKGLTVQAELDTNWYELGQKPTEEQMKELKITYCGPTKDETVKLSYIIDGTKLSDELFPLEVEHLTVFDIRDNPDLLKKEEDRIEKQKKKNQQKKKKSTENAA